MKRILYAIIRRLLWGFYFFFPVKKNRILITSFYGRGYGDNLKYIVNELLKHPNLEIIWLISNDKDREQIPSQIKTCQFGSFRSIYWTTTAGVWIDNCRKAFFYKKKSQFYIQTWHGGGAQKRCELDVIDKLGPGYQKMAVKDSKNIDLMISESRFMTDLYHRSFWYAGPVYESGYPRYDVLLQSDKKIADKVYAFYHIPENKKIVLYAPTFRADWSFDAYDLDLLRLKKNLETRFGGEFVVLVHLHPNVAKLEGMIQYDGKDIINSTFYPDTQELLAATDVLIGDYSSINYDFSLRRLPVFRYASDFAEYQKDRDLYFPYDAYPYPMAQNNDELESLILNFDNDKYLETLNRFFEKIGTVFNTHSSEEIASLVSDYIDSPLKKKEFMKKMEHMFIY